MTILYDAHYQRGKKIILKQEVKPSPNYKRYSQKFFGEKAFLYHKSQYQHNIEDSVGRLHENKRAALYNFQGKEDHIYGDGP